MTEFELWIKACEEFGTSIYCLEGSDDTALYKTWNETEPSLETGWLAGRRNTMFHVWIKGKRRLVCPDYQRAYAAWRRGNETL